METVPFMNKNILPREKIPLDNSLKFTIIFLSLGNLIT